MIRSIRGVRPWLVVLAPAAMLVTVVACKTSPTAPSGQAVTEFVSGASAFGAVGSQQSGPPPAAQTGGPPVTAIGSDSAVDRGVNNYALTSPAPFQKIFISVTASAGGNPPAVANGFLQIDLPAAVTAADVTVDFGDSLPAAAFSLQFQVASPAGVVGTASAIDTTVVNQTVQPVTAFVSGASAFGSSAAQGTLRSGPPPAAQPGGPPVTAIGSGSAFNLGSNVYGVSSPAAFNRIFVSVTASTGGLAATAEGSFGIDLAVPVTQADVAVNFGAGIPASAFQLRFQAASPGGPVGAASALSTTVVGQPANTMIPAGQVVIISPPSDARLGQLENDTTAQVFRERVGFVLTSALAVDFDAPGSFTVVQAAQRSIPAGTRIDSHYLVSDPIGSPPNLSYAGSLTFDTDVLGAMAVGVTLAAANTVVGVPGTLYSGPGAEFESGGDSLTISANRRTVSFSVNVFNGSDNFRVITASTLASAQRRFALASWFARPSSSILATR